MLRAAEIAAASLPKAKVINMLQLPGGSESQQVMLQVRFAEVNRARADGAGHHVCSPTRSGLLRPVDDAAVLRRPISTTTNRRRTGVQRLPEPVLLQHADGIGARAQGAASRRAASRAWPSRT